MPNMVSLCAAAATFFNPGSWGAPEILIVLAIILIFFGPKRLPQLSRSIGKSIREFRKGVTEVKRDIEDADDEPEDEPSSTATTAQGPDASPSAGDAGGSAPQADQTGTSKSNA